jgi:hypothetical protein
VNIEEPAPQSKKQAKKQEQREKKNVDYGGETLMIVPLTTQHIANLSHTADVDNLVSWQQLLYAFVGPSNLVVRPIAGTTARTPIAMHAAVADNRRQDAMHQHAGWKLCITTCSKGR